MKTTFRKKSPKVIQYRNYKHFSDMDFRAELEYVSKKRNILECTNDDYVSLFMEIFNKHAPLKLKYIRAKEHPFMTK